MSYPYEISRIVEDELRDIIGRTKSISKILSDAKKYSLLSGGKRFRPVLHIMAGRLLGIKDKALLPTACAIEMIHTYSLIHDDLPALDDDRLRRGRLTSHIKFGEDTAIMAGDALFADAFYIILSNKYLPTDIVLRLAVELAEAIGSKGMVGGQMLDLKASEENMTENYLKRIYEYKTAKIIAYSVKSAAIISCNEKQVKRFESFGEHIGLAFQIMDDILDEIGEDIEIGKETGSDKRKNKATYISMFGVEKAIELAKEEIQKAKEELAEINIDKRKLFDLADFIISRTK